MKSYGIILVGVIGFFSQSLSDNIYLKSGYVFYNVTILDTVDNHLRVKKINGEVWSYPLLSIYKIDRYAADTTRGSTFEKGEIPAEMEAAGASKIRENFTYPNTRLIPISLIAFGLSYDLFFSAKDLHPDGEKHRAIVPGVLFLAAGVVNLVFVFEKVEVQTDAEKVKLSYTF
jgi:hypothetical protein